MFPVAFSHVTYASGSLRLWSLPTSWSRIGLFTQPLICGGKWPQQGQALHMRVGGGSAPRKTRLKTETRWPLLLSLLKIRGGPALVSSPRLTWFCHWSHSLCTGLPQTQLPKRYTKLSQGDQKCWNVDHRTLSTSGCWVVTLPFPLSPSCLQLTQRPSFRPQNS